MPRAKSQTNLTAAWRWPRARRALQKKLNEGLEPGRQLAERLNYNLRNNIDPDRRLHPEPPKTFEEWFLRWLRQNEVEI